MKKQFIEYRMLNLVGISARTSNSKEMNPDSAIIGKTVGQYFEQNYASHFLERVSPGTTYCVYTNYDSDETGEYTYFVGEEVRSFDSQPQQFDTLAIPTQSYAKFEVGPGKMPEICINAWQKIWRMDSKELGSERTFIADFEIYDERAQDPHNTCLDIFIGIEKN